MTLLHGAPLSTGRPSRRSLQGESLSNGAGHGTLPILILQWHQSSGRVPRPATPEVRPQVKLLKRSACPISCLYAGPSTTMGLDVLLRQLPGAPSLEQKQPPFSSLPSSSPQCLLRTSSAELSREENLSSSCSSAHRMTGVSQDHSEAQLETRNRLLAVLVSRGPAPCPCPPGNRSLYLSLSCKASTLANAASCLDNLQEKEEVSCLPRKYCSVSFTSAPHSGVKGKPATYRDKGLAAPPAGGSRQVTRVVASAERDSPGLVPQQLHPPPREAAPLPGAPRAWPPAHRPPTPQLTSERFLCSSVQPVAPACP